MVEPNYFMSYDNDRLIDVIKNYTEHNYDIRVKSIAYNTLISRELTNEELTKKGEKVTFNEILENVQSRDHIDSTRADSPLLIANDAMELSTDNG